MIKPREDVSSCRVLQRQNPVLQELDGLMRLPRSAQRREIEHIREITLRALIAAVFLDSGENFFEARKAMKALGLCD